MKASTKPVPSAVHPAAPQARKVAAPLSTRRALVWSLVWLLVGLLAGLPLLVLEGASTAVDYWTVYVLERSLSLDNVFVFLLILGYFAVPASNRRRALIWGVVAALILRAVAIVLGAELLERFHIISYILGGVVLVVAWRMLRGSAEELDPGQSPLIRVVRRLMRVTEDPSSRRFIERRDGRTEITPIGLALVAIIAADVTFAIDSIPAAFGVTREAIVIWSANAAALLGLTSLFVLVEALVRRFRYMSQTLAAILAFIGFRLLAEEFVAIPPAASLAVVVGLLIGGLLLSVLADRRRPPPAAEQETRRPPRCPPVVVDPGGRPRTT